MNPTRTEKRSWKERQSGVFADRDFIADKVVPLIPEIARELDRTALDVVIVRSRATDRMTILYTLGSKAVIYGKVYFDPAIASTTHASLRHLWEQGFAVGSRLEIPEPLGFVKEANLLLMRRAQGTPLNEIAVTARLPDALDAVRAAARWLAKFHSSGIPALREESACERLEVLKVTDVFAKLAAERPAHSALLIQLLQDLGDIAPAENTSVPLTPVHGQFRPAHVFIGDGITTVIDIEKIRLSDPAKDVARFVHSLRKTCLEGGCERQRAVGLAWEFVAEYLKLAPSSLKNLSYYRALLAAKARAKLLKNHEVDSHDFEALGEMYSAEFEQAMRGRAPVSRRVMEMASRQISPHVIESALMMETDSRDFSKEALGRKAASLSNPEFISTRILPLAGIQVRHAPESRVEVVQNTGTGRLTLRYDFGGESPWFGKLYCDDLGWRCHQVNCALWDAGFSDAGRYRVPEPGGFLADHNMTLMRSAPGTPLGAALHGDTSVDLVAGSREAARWLVRLHRSSIRTGTPDADWNSLKLFRMARRLIKALGARPDKLEIVRELMHSIEERIAKLPANRPFVLTHGRYHHDHIFLSAEATTVIDLDRCRPSDPAKDAAEFVRVLRLTAFKGGFDMRMIEAATTVFLDTYLAEIPETSVSLGCYWATFVFHSLLGGLKKGRPTGKRSWEELMDFYANEITHALNFPDNTRPVKIAAATLRCQL